MARKEHDVFVLGDETLVAEPDGTADVSLEGDDAARNLDAESVESQQYVTPTTIRNRAAPVPRRLAVLGLSVGATTVIGVSVLSTGGNGDSPPRPQRSTSLVSSPPLPAATPRVAAPSPPSLHRAHHRKRRAGPSEREVRTRHSHMPERETRISKAPVGSTVTIPAAVPPAPSPAPMTIPVPPSPSPSPHDGGGSGGGEEFGFER